jgi:two-component system cell cycle sensor histidine kinase/response regulator CckA
MAMNCLDQTITATLRDRINALAARVDRFNDTVATGETPMCVPWPNRRSTVERPAPRTTVDESQGQSRKLELLGRMAAGVAHDLNNLLAVIGGHAELLAMDAPERGHRHSEVIQSSIRVASQLTNRLLAFSKPPASGSLPVLESVVRESEPLLRAIVGGGIECIVTDEGDPVAVPLSRDRIEQVVLNLVVNARDAIGDHGVLAVHTSSWLIGSNRRGWPADRPAGLYAVLTVADNGRGMDEATLARIFEPYFTTRGEQGTGLGLANVREIVDLARGHIEVETAPGQGALFRVFIPAADPVSGFDHSISHLIARTNGKSALLVDDDEAVRRLAKTWLENAGYDVIETGRGEDALRLARVVLEPIDLLVADYVLPGLGGRKLAERLRFQRPGLPVVFISGYGNPYGEFDGRTRFVSKPFSRGDFMAALDAVAPVPS